MDAMVRDGDIWLLTVDDFGGIFLFGVWEKVWE